VPVTRPGSLALALTLALGCRAAITEPATPPDVDLVPNQATTLHPALARTVERLLPELDTIPAERREALDALAEFVVEAKAAGRPAKLIFICTHNSRRSHISQLWAATAAAWFGLRDIETFSGGTEVTAFNPRAVASMKRAGFVIDEPGGDNPHYQVSLSPAGPALTAFSKTWDDPVNPRDAFAAVMTCSQADESCPFVRGASSRISLPYDDPKLADGTAEEAQVYDQRSRQIAAEMLYVFGVVSQKVE